jgi:putative tryptophan/tyrosine transport system substrate-binding protein
MIKRREFIAGLGGAAAWPVVARAQQGAIPVIAYLSTRSADSDRLMLPAFRRGLNQLMRPKRARKPTISNRWFSGNFSLALTRPKPHHRIPLCRPPI